MRASWGINCHASFSGFSGERQGETNVGANLLDHIDTSGLLNDIFGMNRQQYVENDNDSHTGYIGDIMVGEYDDFDDEPGSNDVMI